MESKPVLKTSVQNLVEFACQSGDIFAFSGGNPGAAEGIKAHQVVRNSYTGGGYASEVPVSLVLERKSIRLEIGGRIDGVIGTGKEIAVEEIKTTAGELPDSSKGCSPAHWAQAKCYSYMYAIKNGIENIGIRLTCYHTVKNETVSFLEHFGIRELESFFNSLVDMYIDWMSSFLDWYTVRDASISRLSFPFECCREGQKKLIGEVAGTIAEGSKLFVQAPTGTGKTMAVLFPAVKAIGEGHISKIFYLTAKTTVKTIAENTLDIMRQNGLRLKSVTITAKEKSCFNTGFICDPTECAYAKGYFDRIRDAIKDIYAFDSFTRTVVEEYAAKHRICPFEFSLDLSGYCDCIICDYNYVFDPRVYLKRYFLQKRGSYCLLIDEAHNLADRAREMFSAELKLKKMLELKNAAGTSVPELNRVLRGIIGFMAEKREHIAEMAGEEYENSNYMQKYGNNHYVQENSPKEIYPLLSEFSIIAEVWLSNSEPFIFREELLDFYLDVFTFMRTLENYDEGYVTYFDRTSDDDFRMKLFCTDPSILLRKAMKRGQSAVLFSATLTPLDYFIHILGGDEASESLRLASPFPRENLCLVLDNSISTRYRSRQFTYDRVAKSISDVVKGKTGNYLVYFPSYRYMYEVLTKFYGMGTDASIIYQREGMTESEREEFLDNFSSPGRRSLVGFAVLGGAFGEGIDLVGERLSGVVIVGVGLPMICLEREIIREYFDRSKGMGYEYSYIYPGMNKVLQAAGRVIRSETDRGVVLLIDDRFSTPVYEELYPPEWHPAQRVGNTAPLAAVLKDFWEEE